MYRGRRDLATHLVHREPARASLGILKPMPEESTPPDLVELVFAPAFRLYEASTSLVPTRATARRGKAGAALLLANSRYRVGAGVSPAAVAARCWCELRGAQLGPRRVPVSALVVRAEADER